MSILSPFLLSAHKGDLAELERMKGKFAFIFAIFRPEDLIGTLETDNFWSKKQSDAEN